MPAIITDKFRLHNSEQFFESFSESQSNTYYLGIGRPQSWKTSNRPDGRTENEGLDNAAILPSESIVEQYYAFDDLLAVKKYTPSDVSKVIPRINYSDGVVFDYYRHDYGKRIPNTTTLQTSNSGASILSDARYYVLTTDNNVYKCLWNNNGAVTSEMPSTTSPSSTQTTSDGYVWKYMYTLSSSQIQNFLSTDFMAVSTDANVNSASQNGSIDIVVIKEAGTGGQDGSYSNIPIRGDGNGGLVEITISAGQIINVNISNGGTNYTFGYITLTDINNAGANSLTGAELDVIIPPKGGHGYDAVSELGGFFVMLNQNLEGDEISNSGDFTVNNDFRKIVLLKDPTSSLSPATSTTLRSTKAVVFASSPTPGTFQVDEKITQLSTGAIGTVVSWDAINRILYYIQPRFADEGLNSNGDLIEFSGSGVISGATSTATGTPDTSVTSDVANVTFSSGYSNPEIDHNSGEVIYIENRAPVNRSADQTENIKLIIEF